MKNEFEMNWNALKHISGKETFQRVDSSHPLDFYVGKDSNGSKVLLLISNQEPRNIKGSRAIAVEIGKRKDDKFAIRFKLVRREEESVFLHLCWDLVESSRDKSNNKHGLAFVFERFLKWQLLLQAGGNGLLSSSEIKGLIGELIFLEYCIESGHDLWIAVDGWQGPLKADRDFEYGNSWYEIKAVNPGTMSVRISSIEQLDTDNLGELVVYYLEKTSSTEVGAITLMRMVNKIRALLQKEPVALSKFEEKMLDAQYLDRQEYDETFFVLRGSSRFRVDERFPRIRRYQLSSSILKVSYEISLSNLSEWKAKE